MWPPTGLIPWFSKTKDNTYATLLHHPFLFGEIQRSALEVATVSWCRYGTTPMGSQESLLRLPGRGVARRAGLVDSTRIVYPGSGRKDA